MKTSEAFERVSAIYIPGAVAYFGRLNPDPWQSAHDDLCAAAATHDWDLISSAALAFLDRCSELLSQFKRNSIASTKLDIRDAFALGNEENLNAAHSRRRKECVRCGSKEDLKIEAFGVDALQVRLVCKAGRK